MNLSFLCTRGFLIIIDRMLNRLLWSALILICAVLVVYTGPFFRALLPSPRHKMPKTPVYFISHGGPNIMEQTSHPAFAKLRQIGSEITSLSPRAILVLSAHWQGPPASNSAATRDEILVNTATQTDLIYDFYGFPKHYYNYKFPHRGDPELANQILARLNATGIKGRGVDRGLDHGAWAPFMVLFPAAENPLTVPIVQVSLFDAEDPVRHFELGRALAEFRDQGVVIVCSGMAVHNLRDLFRGSRPGELGGGDAQAYTLSFDEALREAVESDIGEREQRMVRLLDRKDAREAHPTFEHLLPIYVGVGAAGDDVGRRTWTMPEGSMSWAQYRFG